MRTQHTLLALFLVTVPPMALAQGLGDASRREQKRRSETDEKTDKTTPAKSYGDADLLKAPPLANDPDMERVTGIPGAGSAPASDSAGKTAERPRAAAPLPLPERSTRADSEEVRRAQDEQRWRSRAASARARLEKARETHADYEKIMLPGGMILVDEKGRTVAGSIEELQALTRRAKVELDAAQKALDDLLDEARRANVPPGWLR